MFLTVPITRQDLTYRSTSYYSGPFGGFGGYGPLEASGDSKYGRRKAAH
jgi:hypothetical protein